MNAQEALKNFFIAKKMFEDEVYNSMEVIEDFIDQSNAKPKTLEELGWELVANDEYVERYAKKCALPFLRIDIYKKSKEFAIYSIFGNDIQPYFSLSYEEILAIAEKMKELGMTNE